MSDLHTECLKNVGSPRSAQSAALWALAEAASLREGGSLRKRLMLPARQCLCKPKSAASVLAFEHEKKCALLIFMDQTVHVCVRRLPIRVGKVLRHLCAGS